MPMKFTRNSIPTTNADGRLVRLQAGFTLFEILTVLALASIVFLAVAGRYDFGIDARVKLEAERVRMIARIAHARNEAITAGEELGFTVSDTTVMTGEGKTVELKGVRANRAEFRFDAYGWCQGGNILLTHVATNRSVTIKVGEGGYAE